MELHNFESKRFSVGGDGSQKFLKAINRLMIKKSGRYYFNLWFYRISATIYSVGWRTRARYSINVYFTGVDFVPFVLDFGPF
jgi:hypothetical protein